MPTLPLHPAIVHLPLGLAFAMPLVAAGLAFLYWRQKVPRLAFAVLVGLQALLVGGGIVAMQLGEKDAHRVEAAIGEAAVEAHEERAEAFVWAGAVVLAGSAALLVIPAGAVTVAAAVVVAGSLAVAGLGAWTGHAGGQLVYQHGAAGVFTGAAPVGVAGEGRRGGDRDD